MIRVEGTGMAPESVAEQLRAIDPTVLLVEIEPGFWALGAVRPTAERRMHARVVVEQQAKYLTRTAVATLRLAKLIGRGFAPIAFYRRPELAVADFRRRDFIYRFARELVFERQLAESSGDAPMMRQLDKLLDAARTRGADAFSHIDRRPVSVTLPARSA